MYRQPYMISWMCPNLLGRTGIDKQTHMLRQADAHPQ